MKSNLLAFILGVLAAFPGAALAASVPKPAAPKHDTDAPINIAADKFLADNNSKTGTWTGNVIVTQGDIRMHADTVRVNVVGGKPDTIQAHGNVVVDLPTSGTATGDAGVYNVAPRTVTLTGHVVLTHGKGDVLRGNRLLVNLVTGQASVVDAKENGGTGRVQGIFTPPPQSRDNQTAQ